MTKQELLNWMKANGKKIKIQPNATTEDVKPVGKHTAVGTKYDFVTTNRGAQRTSDIVLKILEKLYNDFTMRRDEERALDWAMNFIREHRKEGE